MIFCFLSRSIIFNWVHTHIYLYIYLFAGTMPDICANCCCPGRTIYSDTWLFPSGNFHWIFMWSPSTPSIFKHLSFFPFLCSRSLCWDWCGIWVAGFWILKESRVVIISIIAPSKSSSHQPWARWSKMAMFPGSNPASHIFGHHFSGFEPWLCETTRALQEQNKLVLETLERVRRPGGLRVAPEFQWPTI